MAVISLIQQYNDLFNGISKASTVEDMRTLETAVKGFYNDYKGADMESALRIVNMYADKLHGMVADNSVAFDKLNERLSNIKGREYDFAGEKDDTAAVQTRMLQLMGQLPKTKTAANASGIKNTINEVIGSGVVGSKAVLQLRKVRGRAVFQYTLDGILVRAWETMADAHDNGFHKSGISDCCRGRKPQYKGYHWSYGEIAC